jgi:uncharacterized membrane protein
MEDLTILPILMRWTHILSACIALGGPFFIRFALLPAASAILDDDTHNALRQRLNAAWRPIVYLVITLFLISGTYNFTTIILGWGTGNPWPLGQYKAAYQALFGLKVMLALWVFFLASALAGRSKAFAFMRSNARLWLTVLIVSLLVIIMISNSLRAIRDKTAPGQPVPADSAHSATAQATQAASH